MKTRLLAGALAAASATLFLARAVGAAPESLPPPASAAQAPRSIASDRMDLSPPLAGLVKLFRSGAPEDVVAAYIETARIPAPNADELVYLHQAGFSSRLLVALLQPDVKPGATAHPAPAPQPMVSSPGYYQTPPAAPQVVAQPAPVYPQPAPVAPYPAYAPSYYAPDYYPSAYYSSFGYDYPYYGGFYPSPIISLGFGFGGRGYYGGHGYGGYRGGYGGSRNYGGYQHVGGYQRMAGGQHFGGGQNYAHGGNGNFSHRR